MHRSGRRRAEDAAANGGTPLERPIIVVDGPLLQTITQTAAIMGLKYGQVRGLIREGRLAHVKIGSRFMIPRGAIEEFIRGNTVQPCQGEIPGRVYATSNDAAYSTFAGPNQVAAESAARALQIASRLK